MTELSRVEIGDIVEFKNSSETLLGIAIGVPSASEIEVAPLEHHEARDKADTASYEFSEDGARRLMVITSDLVVQRHGSVTISVVGQMWNQVARYAALNHYNNVHKPQRARSFTPGDRIPYAGRVFDEHEVLNLVDASLEFWLTSGRFCDEFEHRFASYLGVRKALLVNSGSSANLLAFMTLTSPKLKERRIVPGDEVITAAAGFPTTINPIIQYGAVPVFVDVALSTANLNVSLLDQAWSSKTKAVMVAHALGNPFDLAAVKSFCDKHNLWLIEDNCDALGAEYLVEDSWKLTGTIGDIGTSSFYPPHHMTMGEGGAIYTNSPSLAKIAASFRDWGRDCWCPAGVDNTCGKRFDWQLGQLPAGYDHKYIYSHFGYNLKATDMQAAVGCAQLDKLADFVKVRRRNFEILHEKLRQVEDTFILPQATDNSRPSWFGFLLTLRKHAPERRRAIVAQLEKRGIQTRMLFAGNFTRHPAFDLLRHDCSKYRICDELKNSDHIMMNSFWVGVYPGLTEAQVTFIADEILSAAQTKHNLK